MNKEEEICDEILEIRLRFVNSIPERLLDLEKSMECWMKQEYHDRESCQKHLTGLSHQLVGTAGSLGFLATTLAARNFNEKLRSLNHNPELSRNPSMLKLVEEKFLVLVSELKSCSVNTPWEICKD